MSASLQPSLVDPVFFPHHEDNRIFTSSFSSYIMLIQLKGDNWVSAATERMKDRVFPAAATAAAVQDQPRYM